MADSDVISRLVVRQADALVANRYEIRPVSPSGEPGELLAVAEQKVLAMRKQVAFFADPERTEPIFGFAGRERLETYTIYDVTAADGTAIAWFKKDFRRSITRSTWRLVVEGNGLETVGTERNAPVALLRRAWNLVLSDYLRAPLNFHFDFRDPSGRIVLTSRRRRRLRDVYDVELLPLADGSRLDWRIGAAIGVALDTLEHR